MAIEMVTDIGNLVKAIETADKCIRPGVRETDVTRSSTYAEASGADVFFKLEHLQRTGSFKLRGALNALCSLTEAQKRLGVVTASTGNHGAAVTHAARHLGISATVIVPETAADAKVAAIRRMGAAIEVYGNDCLAAETFARRRAGETGQRYIPPYNDWHVVAGQGTIGLELLRQIEGIDAVFASLGGGGLISGIAAALKAHRPGIRVIGCSPERSKVMVESVKAGRILDLPSLPTLSDGTAGGVEAGAITFDLCRRLVDDYVTVTEAEIASEMRTFMAAHHYLIEGAAATAIAGFVKYRPRLTGKRVVIVLCGRNIGMETLKAVLSN